MPPAERDITQIVIGSVFDNTNRLWSQSKKFSMQIRLSQVCITHHDIIPFLFGKKKCHSSHKKIRRRREEYNMVFQYDGYFCLYRKFGNAGPLMCAMYPITGGSRPLVAVVLGDSGELSFYNFETEEYSPLIFNRMN
jgi:predicted dehydrogenase